MIVTDLNMDKIIDGFTAKGKTKKLQNKLQETDIRKYTRTITCKIKKMYVWHMLKNYLYTSLFGVFVFNFQFDASFCLLL